MEGALLARNQQVAALTSKVGELEAEVESTRHEQRTFGSVFAAKERDQGRKLEGLQDEVTPPAEAPWAGWRVRTPAARMHHRGARAPNPAPRLRAPRLQVEHQKEKVGELERLLKERGTALSEARARTAAAAAEREDADHAARERGRRLAEEREVRAHPRTAGCIGCVRSGCNHPAGGHPNAPHQPPPTAFPAPRSAWRRRWRQRRRRPRRCAAPRPTRRLPRRRGRARRPPPMRSGAAGWTRSSRGV